VDAIEDEGMTSPEEEWACGLGGLTMVVVIYGVSMQV
jgi:hypothetical protein